VNELLYVYGFVPAGLDTGIIGVPGIAGAAIELIDADDAPQAVVSRLDAGEYSAEVIDLRMNDLAWVAEQGVAHERVVAWFIDHAEILPAPLFTLYSSEDALRGVIYAQRERLERELTRLRGLREWDLKVSYDRQLLARNAGKYSDEVAAIDREMAAASPGKQYLLKRKRDDLLRDGLAETARRLAMQVLDEVRSCATELVTLPPPTEETPVVLNAALLVAAQQDAALVERLERARRNWQDAGLEIEFSGPWAPYRFIVNE